MSYNFGDSKKFFKRLPCHKDPCPSFNLSSVKHPVAGVCKPPQGFNVDREFCGEKIGNLDERTLFRLTPPNVGFLLLKLQALGPPVSSSMASWEIPELNGGIHSKIWYTLW